MVQGDTAPAPELLCRQQYLSGQLEAWLYAYKSFFARRKAKVPLYDDVQDHALRSHHAMATIIVASCISPQGPAVDACTAGFLSILTHSLGILDLRRSTTFEQLHKKMYGTAVPQGPDHVIEMGWIPPLYYTAVNCRIPHLRFQAIRLLERSPHREGVWAAPIMAAIARKVMRIEDSESYDKLCNKQDFAWDVLPTKANCVLPPIDEYRMFHNVQIVLPDEPAGDVVIRCERRRRSGGWELIERAYDVPCARWRTVTEPAALSLKMAGAS